LKKRKVYDNNYKARVALEAIKGEKTISEIAGQYEVHPNQIVKWKKQLLENVSSLFSKKKDPKDKDFLFGLAPNSSQFPIISTH